MGWILVIVPPIKGHGPQSKVIVSETMMILVYLILDIGDDILLEPG